MRIKSRRSATKAVIAIAADRLQAATFLLRDGVDYKDLGLEDFERQDKNRAVRSHIKRLQDLGF